MRCIGLEHVISVGFFFFSHLSNKIRRGNLQDDFQILFTNYVSDYKLGLQYSFSINID